MLVRPDRALRRLCLAATFGTTSVNHKQMFSGKSLWTKLVNARQVLFTKLCGRDMFVLGCCLIAHAQHEGIMKVGSALNGGWRFQPKRWATLCMGVGTVGHSTATIPEITRYSGH